MPFNPEPGREQELIGRIQADGLLVNKATFLDELTDPDGPEFPLDAELLSMVPQDLPGEMPESVSEHLDLLASSISPQAAPTAADASSSATTVSR